MSIELRKVHTYIVLETFPLFDMGYICRVGNWKGKRRNSNNCFNSITEKEKTTRLPRQQGELVQRCRFITADIFTGNKQKICWWERTSPLSRSLVLSLKWHRFSPSLPWLPTSVSGTEMTFSGQITITKSTGSGATERIQEVIRQLLKNPNPRTRCSRLLGTGRSCSELPLRFSGHRRVSKLPKELLTSLETGREPLIAPHLWKPSKRTFRDPTSSQVC